MSTSPVNLLLPTSLVQALRVRADQAGITVTELVIDLLQVSLQLGQDEIEQRLNGLETRLIHLEHHLGKWAA